MQAKRWLRGVLLALGVGFLLYVVYGSQQELKQQIKSLDLVLFGAAIVTGVLGSFVVVALNRLLFIRYSVRLKFSEAARLYFYGQIAKYIPGKVWLIIYQSMALGIKGSMTVVTLVNVEMMIVLLLTTSSVAGILIFSNKLLIFSILIFVLSIVFLYQIHSKCLLRKILEKITIYFPKVSRLLPDCIGAGQPLFAIWFYVSFLTLYLISYWFFLSSFLILEWQEFVLYCACLSIAWVVGVATLVFPGGIGIREFLFIVLASQFSEAPDVSVLGMIAVLSRLMIIGQEVLGVLLMWVFDLVCSSRSRIQR